MILIKLNTLFNLLINLINMIMRILSISFEISQVIASFNYYFLYMELIYQIAKQDIIININSKCSHRTEDAVHLLAYDLVEELRSQPVD